MHRLSDPKLHRRLTAAVAATVFVCVVSVLRCAHQVAPGGGPVDQTPPEVRQSVPHDGAVDVARDIVIAVTFEEWISPASAAKSVAIFPPPEGIDVRVKGRTLLMEPSALLAESTTYHVTITNELEDLRGVSVGKPHHLTFSTGPTLDSGSVSGCVVDPRKRILQPKVALYRVADPVPDTLPFDRPTYLSQTDSSGAFEFRHVHRGSYLLIGFDDENGDNRLQPGHGSAYAPLQRTVVVDPHATSLVLYPVSSDTTSRRVTSCEPVSQKVILVTWNRRRPLSARGVASDSFMVKAVDSLGHMPAISTVYELDPLRSALVLDEPMRLSPYQLHYRIVPFVTPPDTVSMLDSVRFNGVVHADTTAPRLTSRTTFSNMRLWPALEFVWSEPVSTIASGILFSDSLGDTVPAAVGDTSFGDTVRLRPVRRLLPGRHYRLWLPFESIRDLGGLHPEDTADSVDTNGLAVSITTIQADSVCLSLAGGAACLPEDSARVWRFRPVDGGSVAETQDSAGHFRFDSIPGGHGLLAYYSDRDADGTPQQGELVPWMAPEPYVPFYDTVEARARWDIGGIEVPGCDPCKRGQVAETDTATQNEDPAQ